MNRHRTGFVRRVVALGSFVAILGICVACREGDPLRGPFPASENAHALSAQSGNDLGQWPVRYSDASRGLAHWIRTNPGAAQAFFSWADRNPTDSQLLLNWAVRHPYAVLTAHVEEKENWAELREAINAYPQAFLAFSSWCRQNRTAAHQLTEHPGDMAWIGDHIYGLKPAQVASFNQLYRF